MIEKDIRKLLDIVEEKSVESTQINENQSNLQDVAEGSTDDGDNYDDGEDRLSGRHGLSADPKKMAVYYPNDPERTKIRTQMNIPNLKKAIQSNLGKHKKPNLPEQGVAEGPEDTFMSTLKGLKSWQVVIMNNYYRGKYSDYSGRYYYVLATSPEEARQVVLDNADAILQDLLSMKSVNGKKILPRGSAIAITDKRIGEIKDGTEAGRMTTAGFKRMFGPQGPMMVKLSGGAVVDVQSQEQGVAEGSLKESSIKFGIKQALKEGYWDDIGKAVLDFKGSELPRNYRKLEINSDSPHYKLHADEFKKDVWDQLKDKGVAVAKQIAPAKKVGGVSLTPELLLQIWRKLENVVSNVVPDGDPIDWMAPYIRKMGVDPFYTREILDKAVKRHYDKRSDYSKYLQDMWDAYGEMQGDDYKNPWK